MQQCTVVVIEQVSFGASSLQVLVYDWYWGSQETHPMVGAVLVRDVDLVGLVHHIFLLRNNFARDSGGCPLGQAV